MNLSKEDEAILHFRNELKKDIEMIPVFVDLTLSSNSKAIDIYRRCYIYLSKLFIKPVMLQGSIVFIVDSVNDRMCEISELCGVEMSILFYEHILDMLEYYLIKFTEEELFETCTNIQKAIKEIKNL